MRKDRRWKPFDPEKTLIPGAFGCFWLTMTGDTNWIFDGIRSDMRHNKFDDAIRRLDNYLDDPMAPHMDEAVFLKGLCLERTRKMPAARRVFQMYLERWPAGKRAKQVEAKLAGLR